MSYTRQNKRSALILCFFLCLFITTGCAHKRLIHAAEDFTQQGRYEQAVEKYQKALRLKPDDQVTRQKLDAAQQSLDLWLDKLLTQAQAAKQQGLDGRALLLFAKVAQLRRSATALNQYKQLHRQLSDRHSYQIAIDYPGTLGSNPGLAVADIRLIAQADSSKDNQFSVKISHKPATFSSISAREEKVQQYVSGTATIANPDYLHLQDDIVNQRAHVHQLAADYDHQLHLSDKQQRQLLSQQQALARAKQQLAKSNNNPPLRRHLQQDIERIEKALQSAQNSYDKTRKKLDRLDHTMVESQHQLNRYLDELSYLPPTVAQNVLSDYVYDIETVTRSAAGGMTLGFSNGVTQAKNVSVSDSDESHEAHKRIKLDFNPVTLMDDNELTDRYYQKVAEQAAQSIARHAAQYRDGLRDRANRQSGIDEKMEAWVRYGISAKDGVDDHTARQMTRQLQQEFGIAGEFGVNILLHLFD